MALPASGQITLNQVNVELGLSGTAQIGMNDAAVRGLFGIASGEIEMSDGYGKSSETLLTSAGNVNGQAQQKQITISNFIDSGGTLRVPSNIWVWSDSTNPALIIDIPCTLINEGKIIGQGGVNSGEAGNPAIKINSGVSGVTIQNLSGAYIAGGGGSGTGGSGNGGGAGGGRGYSGDGGTLNASGSNGYNQNGGAGLGGGAGGGGNGNVPAASYFYGNGGGGGRILPGSGGGAGGSGGGAGGSAGNNGNGGTTAVYGGAGYPGGAGGGGWGAYGGQTPSGNGGAGGKAVDDSGVSYTLSNSGTIYGAT